MYGKSISWISCRNTNSNFWAKLWELLLVSGMPYCFLIFWSITRPHFLGFLCMRAKYSTVSKGGVRKDILQSPGLGLWDLPSSCTAHVKSERWQELLSDVTPSWRGKLLPGWHWKQSLIYSAPIAREVLMDSFNSEWEFICCCCKHLRWWHCTWESPNM